MYIPLNIYEDIAGYLNTEDRYDLIVTTELSYTSLIRDLIYKHKEVKIDELFNKDFKQITMDKLLIILREITTDIIKMSISSPEHVINIVDGPMFIIENILNHFNLDNVNTLTLLPRFNASLYGQIPPNTKYICPHADYKKKISKKYIDHRSICVIDDCLNSFASIGCKKEPRFYIMKTVNGNMKLYEGSTFPSPWDRLLHKLYEARKRVRRQRRWHYNPYRYNMLHMYGMLGMRSPRYGLVQPVNRMIYSRNH